MLRPPLPLLPETSQLGLQRGAQRCLRTGLPCAALGLAWVSQWILDLGRGGVARRRLRLAIVVLREM